MKRAAARLTTIVSLWLLLALVAPLPVASPRVVLSADSEAPEIDDYIVDVVELDDGSTVVGYSFPSPPPDPDLLAARQVVERYSASSVVLTDVPAFNWCYGCSATSAAMMFGFYDRNGYPYMYTGPTNGGVCPLTNAAWGNGNMPLSATKMGLDGLATYGHVDDYWSGIGSSIDPYLGNWEESGYADCTADFMGTSQYVNWGNQDGSTTFFFAGGNSPLYDYSGHEDLSSPRRDGNHGMSLFAESRGYTVVQNYNQYIYGHNSIFAGFTFAQYCQEIDAGRPVIIQVDGHSMLGVGYDTTGNTVYLHDTWGYGTTTMTWGGIYSGMQHYGVGVLQLEEAPSAVEAPQARTDDATVVTGTGATLNGTVLSDGGEACQYRFSYGAEPGSYTESTGWTGSLSTGEAFSAAVSGLSKGQPYYFIAELKNSEGEVSGGEQQFVTRPDAPSAFLAEATGAQSIGLSWTSGDGAGAAQVQRKAGSYPADRDDGTTVYSGSGTSATDTGLVPDTTYYYRAWSEAAAGGVWSDDYAEDMAATDGVLPVVSTQAAIDITATSALLQGTIVDARGDACQYRFEYDTGMGVPYAHSTDWTGDVNPGETFASGLSALSPGTLYFYRAQAKNTAGESSGVELSFTTLPSAPTSLSATPSGEDTVALSWTPGNGATDTFIVRKAGGYPADRSDGEQVYFDGGTLCSDYGLSAGTDYYYRAWAYHFDSDQYSAVPAEADATTPSDGTAAIAISPADFDVVLPSGVTRDYELTVLNNGDGTLDFTIGESIPPTPPPAPGESAASTPAEEGAAASATAEVSPSSTENVNEVIVKFKSGVRASTAEVHANLGVATVARAQSGRFDVVRVPEGRKSSDVVRDYLDSGLVEYVEPNYGRSVTWAPDDSRYPEQWNFDQVNAEAAWDIQHGGSADVIVAVLDTGVAYETYSSYVLAPDLAGTAFLAGWDFVNNDGHPNDDNGHGTHVTGTIAQATNNGIGVAGLAFGVTIMPVKVLNEGGTGTVAQVADGIYYAVDNGADIINLSLSGSGWTQTELDAVEYALSRGVTVVCAAGNAGPTGPDQYPAAFPSTIAVGATKLDQARASYSNTGNYIDIVAPGGDSVNGVLQQTFPAGSPSSFSYEYKDGTSMAAPHVSAAAALLLSENRSLSPDDVRDVLETTAFELGPAGWDEEYGHGLLDVAAALAEVAGVPWLDETPKQGTVAPSGSQNVLVTVDTGGLEIGDYFGTIVVSSNDPAHPTTNVSFAVRVRAVLLPSVTTEPATGVEETDATLHGEVLDYGWEPCDYSFEYGTVQGAFDQQTAWSGQLGSGEQFSEALSELDEGTTYYFVARARNSAGTGYGDEFTFTTKPAAPANLQAAPDPNVPFYRIELTWDAGAGAARTYIFANTDHYPVDRTDGDLVYDGDASSFTHTGLAPSTTYYYRAWSRVEDHLGHDVWSDSYDDDNAMTEAEPALVDLSITLQPGWNMVSVPLLMQDMATSQVFPGAVAVYTWDSAGKSYAVPSHVTREHGYWVAMTVETPVTWHGVPVSEWEAPIVAGWNMVGSVLYEDPVGMDSVTTNAYPDPLVRNAIYSWDPVSKSYQNSATILAGRGYWLASTSDCTLSMSLPA
jgi:subtilisin family serine protease